MTHNNGCSSDAGSDLLKANHQKGMRFEAEVREYYREMENFDELPKQNINILEDSSRKRYPDIVFEKEIDKKMVLHVIEVKNVKRLNLTAQIKDFINATRKKGGIFTIVVKDRQDLKISKHLQKTMDEYNFPIIFRE